MMKKIWKNSWVQLIVGVVIYAVATNVFITPLALYNGGIVGIAQVIRTIIVDQFGLDVSFDLAAILNFLLNIPLFVLAYKSMNPKYFYSNLIAVVTISIVMSICPIPAIPWIQEKFASAVIGGFACGIGISMILNIGGSAGGLDILGIYMALHFKNFSVGKMTLIINSVLFLICAVLFDIPTAIYSIVNTFVFTTVLDKRHVKNLESTLMIFTENEAVKQMIMSRFVRGVTYWQGKGAYTESKKEILITVCAQAEINEIEEEIRKMDQQAFVIVIPDLQVTGGFEKRLIMK